MNVNVARLVTGRFRRKSRDECHLQAGVYFLDECRVPPPQRKDSFIGQCSINCTSRSVSTAKKTEMVKKEELLGLTLGLSHLLKYGIWWIVNVARLVIGRFPKQKLS